MSTPYEVIGAPYQIYLAPVSTAFPDVGSTPPGPWVLLGTSGYLNYNEDGVTVEHNQTLSTFRPAGSTANRKAWRTAEELKITVKLVDLSPTYYAKIMNDATVTTVSASPTVSPSSKIPLLRGLTVATFALLCKGLAPTGDSYSAQFEVPIVYEDGSPKPVFKKGVPAELECSFMALNDDTYQYGNLNIQTGAHS